MTYNLITIIVGVMLGTVFSCCSSRGPTNQPGISFNIKEKQVFNNATSFPYHADDARKSAIRKGAESVSVGMDGDKVFDTLGAPDEVTELAFAMSRPYGWSWTYNLVKMYPRATADEDKFLDIMFDKNGFVSRIVRKNLTPDPP